MKFVCEGKTYDTDKSNRIASYSNFHNTIKKEIFQTASGVFFEITDNQSVSKIEVLGKVNAEDIWAHIESPENLNVYNEKILPFPDDA